MTLSDTQSISLSTSKYTWEDIDKRCKELNMNRSKYTQMLYEHDIDNSVKHHFDIKFIVVILFLMTILAAILTLIGLLL